MNTRLSLAVISNGEPSCCPRPPAESGTRPLPPSVRITPYVGRRSFARWMEECGIPETHQQAYLGHGPRTITDRIGGRRSSWTCPTPMPSGWRAGWPSNVVGKVVGPIESEPSQVVMTRAGIEPAAYGLKVAA